MKKNYLMSVMALILSLSAQAQEVRNGGGEDGVFKSIRDEIKVWVDKNAGLEKLSQKLGVDQPEAFREKLEQAMARVGDRVIFNRREIQIAGNVRICENNPATATITCNVDAWSQSRGDTRYMIVLHEYLGIAGIEGNAAEYSRYPVSPKLLS